LKPEALWFKFQDEDFAKRLRRDKAKTWILEMETRDLRFVCLKLVPIFIS